MEKRYNHHKIRQELKELQECRTVSDRRPAVLLHGRCVKIPGFIAERAGRKDL